MDNNHIPHSETDENAAETPRTPLETFMYHQKRALEETGKALDALVPPGFKEHGAEASREFTKGFKVLIDAAINELERMNKEYYETKQRGEDGDDRPSSTGPNKVKVQVE